ncbi:MAG: cytochrome c oxidase subunit II [Planctomyces sp.]|nr:cytochrome c oxidase subunit II [Planctomyces sp.]
MLHPGGSAAAEIAWLTWFLIAVCGGVFVAVMALTAAAVWRRSETADAGESAESAADSESRKPPPASPVSPLGAGFIIVAGAVIPALILTVILVLSVKAQVALAPPESDITIRVVGHQFWWEVEYPETGIVTANELIIPAGEPVRLELSAADVIHSLWAPNLNGKTDLLPDKVNIAWLESDSPGVYRAQCAEYCGVQHALMALRIVALPRDEYDAWSETSQASDPEPATEPQRRGRDVYFRTGCHNCHAIAHTAATGRRGPDLTHFGSRLTIAAGVVPNTPENLREWIANPQGMKPGNLMPHTELTRDELDALVDYLMSLD